MADSGWNDAARIIAIDIGGGSTKLALISAKGTVECWQAFATVASSGAVFLEKVIAACRGLQGEAAVPVVGVSVAVAGFVRSNGTLEYNRARKQHDKLRVDRPLGCHSFPLISKPLCLTKRDEPRNRFVGNTGWTVS